jgi:hypothetical protein
LRAITDELGELGGGGLVGGQVGDCVDGLDRDLSGSAVYAAAFDLDGLAGAGEQQAGDGAGLDPADLAAAVAGAAGAPL